MGVWSKRTKLPAVGRCVVIVVVCAAVAVDATIVTKWHLRRTIKFMNLKIIEKQGVLDPERDISGAYSSLMWSKKSVYNQLRLSLVGENGFAVYEDYLSSPPSLRNCCSMNGVDG